MEVWRPLQGGLGNVGAELSRLSGLSSLRAGKQMLDKGGTPAELALLAKRAACDAVAADADLATGLAGLAELYEEAARLCAGANDEFGYLAQYTEAYKARAAVARQAQDLFADGAPKAPTLSPEEWHAARVLLPMRQARAQLGLGPPVGGVVDGAALAGGQIFRTMLCMDDKVDAAARRVGRSPSLWPLREEEWDSLHFPPIFLRTASELEELAGEGAPSPTAPLPRHPSLHARAAALPSAAAPETAPVRCCRLPGVTVAQVHEAFKADPWPIEIFYQEYSAAAEFASSEWQKESRILGTHVRGLKYVMPLPQDVPSAVTRLVAIPEMSKVTTVLRLRASAEEVILLMQSVAHDAPFGERFRTQETFRFRSEEDGVALTKWAEVVWVEPLGWAMALVTKIIESKSMDGMMESVDTFSRILQETCARRGSM